MSGHRQRVIPKRMWSEGEWHSAPTDNENDPRNDFRDGSDVYADELMLAEFRKEVRIARERQEKN